MDLHLPHIEPYTQAMERILTYHVATVGTVKRFSPAEYLKLSRHARESFAETRFVPPSIGTRGFGCIEVIIGSDSVNTFFVNDESTRCHG